MNVIEGNFSRANSETLQIFLDNVEDLIEQMPPDTHIAGIMGVLEIIKMNLLLRLTELEPL